METECHIGTKETEFQYLLNKRIDVIIKPEYRQYYKNVEEITGYEGKLIKDTPRFLHLENVELIFETLEEKLGYEKITIAKDITQCIILHRGV